MQKPLLATLTLGTLMLAATNAVAVPMTFNYTGSIQQYVVTATGNYSILAYGAQGGGINVGLGAEIGGTFSLTAGTVLSILVGGEGVWSSDAGSGGGGSFVFDPIDLLIAAGGGGGNSPGSSGSGGAGQITQNGQAGTGDSGGAGGVGGNGGLGGLKPGLGRGGGGGAGWLSDGGNGTSANGGLSAPSFAGGSGTNVGGYGGGGGGSFGSGGGGGGGYSGGGGGGFSGQGGGGGSYLDASAYDTVQLAGVRSGNGLVTIEQLASVPEPASLLLTAIGLFALTAVRRRRG